MIRKIVNIEESKCNGCGLCAKACHEGAIEMINGKAKLVSDEYCDGLGDCLPNCPTGAITIIERESKNYDEEAVEKRMKAKTDENHKETAPIFHGCPGSISRVIKKSNEASTVKVLNNNKSADNASELTTWPVQLKLVNTKASYLQGADLLIAADCTAYAYGNIHKDFMAGRVTLIGCPKLDDNQYYLEKIEEILKTNNIKSITVLRMEVPCCGGIVHAVREAMLNARTIIPYNEVVIGTDGKIMK